MAISRAAYTHFTALDGGWATQPAAKRSVYSFASDDSGPIQARFRPDSDTLHDGKPGVGAAGTEFRPGNARHDFEAGWFDRLNLPACGKRFP